MNSDARTATGQKVSGSSLAETMALVNGICHTLTELRPGPGSKIIAQTDCRTAIEILSMPELRRAKTRKNFGPLRAVFLDRVAAAAVTVEFRHVRGHKGTETTRNAVNTWCDQECRRLMRAARDGELANASTPQPGGGVGIGLAFNGDLVSASAALAT
jgi:hypothetical protein